MRSWSMLLKNIVRLSILVSSAALLISCDASSGISLPDPEVDETSPTVIQFYPDGNIVDFEVDQQVTIKFSELINEDSINDDGIILYSGDFSDTSEDAGAVRRDFSIDLSVAKNEGTEPNPATGLRDENDITVATITPDGGRFALNNIYSVVLNEHIRDIVEDDLETEEDERNFFDKNQIIEFTTQPGDWTIVEDPVFITNESGSAETLGDDKQQLVIASNSNGVFLTSFIHQGNSVWVSRMSSKSYNWMAYNSEADQEGYSELPHACQLSGQLITDGCVNTLRLDAQIDAEIESLDSAINQSGQAVVAWLQDRQSTDGTAIWVAAFHQGKWSQPRDISSTFQTVSENEVDIYGLSINEQGWVNIAWRETENNTKLLRSTSFNVANFADQGATMSPLILSSTSDLSNNSYSNIQSTWVNNSTALVMWKELTNGKYSLFSREIKLNSAQTNITSEVLKNVENYTEATQQYASGDTVNFIKKRNRDGDIAVIWRKFDGDVVNLMMSTYVQGAWSKVVAVESDQRGSVSNIDLQFGGDNTLYLIWTLVLDEQSKELNFTTYHFGEGFETPTLLATLESQTSEFSLNFDFEGNGMVSWIDNDVNFPLVSGIRYSKLTKEWGDNFNFSLKESDDIRIDNKRISKLTEDGRFIALWFEYAREGSTLHKAIFKE